jgi:hypothetical protein
VRLRELAQTRAAWLAGTACVVVAGYSVSAAPVWLGWRALGETALSLFWLVTYAVSWYAPWNRSERVTKFRRALDRRCLECGGVSASHQLNCSHCPDRITLLEREPGGA